MPSDIKWVTLRKASCVDHIRDATEFEEECWQHIGGKGKGRDYDDVLVEHETRIRMLEKTIGALADLSNEDLTILIRLIQRRH